MADSAQNTTENGSQVNNLAPTNTSDLSNTQLINNNPALSNPQHLSYSQQPISTAGRGVLITPIAPPGPTIPARSNTAAGSSMTAGHSTTTGPATTAGPSSTKGTGAAPGTSTTWNSKLVTETVRLIRLQNMAGHLGFADSPFFPKTLEEYTEHLQAMQKANVAAAQKKLENRMAEMRARDDNGEQIKVGSFLNGKGMKFLRSDSLGKEQERIWGFGNTAQDAVESALPWPTTVELKFEGDRRAKMGLDRRLPVPKRTLDEATAVRLVKLGVPTGVMEVIQAASEGMVELMLNDAIQLFCGMNEATWRQKIMEMMEEEEKETFARQQAVLAEQLEKMKLDKGKGKEPASSEPEPEEEEEITFDEEALSKIGMWKEILEELDCPGV